MGTKRGTVGALKGPREVGQKGRGVFCVWCFWGPDREIDGNWGREDGEAEGYAGDGPARGGGIQISRKGRKEGLKERFIHGRRGGGLSATGGKMAG